MMTMIEHAKRAATRSLEGRTDKAGKPLIEHCERVANRVAHFGVNYAVAAWLHEVLEEGDEIDWRPYPLSVRMADEALTRGELYTYRQYIDNIERVGGIALVVKVNDLLDNMNRTRYNMPNSLYYRYKNSVKILAPKYYEITGSTV